MKKISLKRSVENVMLSEALELFLRKCRVKNLSERTIENYRDNIGLFEQFYGEKTVSNIDKHTVDDYVFWIRNDSGRRCGAIAINTYLRSLRAFLYYCMDCGYVKQFKMELLKTDKTVKETYTEEELERLLEKPDIEKCGFCTYRTWVFENYLLGTANRLSTALNVKIGDIDFENGSILLHKTKNRQQQYIPLSASLSGILGEYLEIRGGEADDYLFCDEYGQKASLNSFRIAVRKYNIKRNVNKTSIHVFRHTFAKNWILAGGDPFRLQKILGHSSLTITREYVNMFGQDLQLDFEKFNPLDRMKQKSGKIRV